MLESEYFDTELCSVIRTNDFFFLIQFFDRVSLEKMIKKKSLQKSFRRLER